MADPKQIEVLTNGVGGWNRWRAEHSQVPNLSGASLGEVYLSSANLNKADFRGAHLWRGTLCAADLSEANLQEVSLREADLSTADLTGADLSEADLFKADLTNASLRNANLRNTNLHNVNLTRADLSYADLSGARLFETIFANTNLDGSKGLDSCVHSGPSTIDHRTLTQNGRLPLAFLRGCGLSDKLIDYLPSLLNEAIQFYSCFISYSTKDQEFADRLHADLQNKGVRCWFAPHQLQGGKKLHEQIDEAIRIYDRLLLILSEASIDSEWVKTEIAKARKRENREERRMLFPVRLVEFATLRDWEYFDADTGKDSAREIREYYVPDFSNWKDHDAYQKAFAKLLRDLQAAKRKPTI